MTKTLRALAALIAVLAALLTSGCSAHTPTTVAVVDGARVTESEIQAAVDRLAVDMPEQDPATLRDFVASYAVIDKLLPRLQREVGATVTDAEIAKAVPQVKAGSAPALAKAMEDKALAPTVRAMAALQALAGKVKDPEQITQALKNAPVEMNPRYGTWPPAENDGTGFNSLSRFFEQPSAQK